ncbi:Hypothetical predicted protein [Paramuricea clavata]|uniref:DNA 3'-5' helicase n=1 Tax=Paramuricea clavata TaxID=317549 RepID=A0A7D9DB91_PARCT|nr:Hypothetical predicted protein [Paramuricea clavata]
MALVEEAKLEEDCFQHALQQVCYFFQVQNLFEDQVNAIKERIGELQRYSVSVLLVSNTRKPDDVQQSSFNLNNSQQTLESKSSCSALDKLAFWFPGKETTFSSKETTFSSKETTFSFVPVLGMESPSCSNPYLYLPISYLIKISMFADINLIVCTATATKATKILDLKMENTFSIEKSPERPNIAYVTQYVENDMELSDVFHDVILDVKDKKDKYAKNLIYCQTRKQAAIIWRTFKLHLAKTYGHVRVLICTIAFGMGLDLNCARKVIHFGPSRTTECYLQECGRVGREWWTDIDLDKMDLDDTLDIDWLDIRDDSSADVLPFQDSSLLQVSDKMDELDKSIASLTLDTSGDIRNIAKKVTSVINTEDMEL